MADVERRTYTVDEVSVILGVSNYNVQALVATGKIPSVRLGRQVVVSRQVIEQLLSVGELDLAWAGRRNMDGSYRKPVSVEEFCDATGIPPATVYDQIRRNTIPHSRVGQRILIPRWVLESVVEGEFRSGETMTDPEGN